MEGYIAPLVLLILLFVGFGLVHRNGEKARGCTGKGGCGGDCSNKTECSNEDRLTN